MRRRLTILAALGTLLAVLALGVARAEEPTPETAPVPPPPAPLIAVAMGQLKESDGGSATVDLRAGQRFGRTGGTLRFYDPEHGYYNGVVRRLSVENGAIKAAGAGGLWTADLRRRQVRFEAEFSADGRQVKISVYGRDGFAYTLEGSLDPGFVRAGPPPRPAAVAPATVQ